MKENLMVKIDKAAAKKYLSSIGGCSSLVEDEKSRREKALDVMLGVLREENGISQIGGVAEDADYSHLNLDRHDKRFHGGRFDEKTMTCKLRDDLEKSDNPDAALAEHETKMAGLSGKKVEEYARLLGKKRKDLDPEETLLKIASIKDVNLQGDSFRWLLKGAIRLPEDLSKVREAREYAARAKKDPFSYETPQACVNDLAAFKPKEKAIDPDTVPELSDKKVLPMGVTTYLVQDDQKGQAAMRRIIDTHWGKDANPWCLLHGDGHGHISDGSDGGYDAWYYWNQYNALPKRVAFKDGKLLAFMATDTIPSESTSVEEDEHEERLINENPELYKEYEYKYDHYELPMFPSFFKWLEENHIEKIEGLGEQWWDRNDQDHEGIPVGNQPVKDDPYGRWADFEIRNGEVERIGRYQKGTLGKPGCITWYDNGQKKSEEGKDGHGTEWYDNGQKKSEKGKDGHGTEWYDNGQKMLEQDKDGHVTQWYKNGKPKQIWSDDLGSVYFNPNGVIVDMSDGHGNTIHFHDNGIPETVYSDDDIYKIYFDNTGNVESIYDNGRGDLLSIDDDGDLATAEPVKEGESWFSNRKKHKINADENDRLKRMANGLLDKWSKVAEDLRRKSSGNDKMNLREVADAAIRESELVATEDAAKQLDKLKQLCRMGKISKAEFKTGLAGLYAAGLITMNQFDVAKRQFK